MDFKLDYMARMFRSIRNKRFESYAIQRIWHQLNDERVQFVTQQYFRRSENGEYALADLYLPQIKLIVEIDEPPHSVIENQLRDEQRSNDIKAVSDVEIKRIPVCKDLERDEWLTLTDFNKEIDEVVRHIKGKIAEQGDNFKTWEGDNILSPEYHIKKGYLSVAENEYVKSIDDAAQIFSTKAIHKGFLRAGGFDVPNKEGFFVWMPSANSRIWNNKLSQDGLFITEYNEKEYNKPYNKENEKDRKKHVEDVINNKQSRITFFREKDALGFNFYKFVGVFMLNEERTRKENKFVWERISDRYDLRE